MKSVLIGRLVDTINCDKYFEAQFQPVGTTEEKDRVMILVPSDNPLSLPIIRGKLYNITVEFRES